MAEEPRIGEPLPRAQEAVIPRAKLVDYALDPDHPYGRHKAYVFKSVLGIERGQWRHLHDQILAGLAKQPVSSYRPAKGDKSETWGVVIPIMGLNGRTALVVTTWQMVASAPRMASIFVRKTARVR